MLSRHRFALAVVTAACLFVASGASADPLNTFTAAGGPSHVKPAASASYTIALTSDSSAPDPAQRATIEVPSGFSVDPLSVSATTTAAGPCGAAAWEADGPLIADQKIHLWFAGADANALCPGATLTVAFAAESSAAEGTYTWTSELLHDVAGPFTLSGSQPSVVVDGTAPTSAITAKPADPSNDASPSFEFTAGEPATFECKLDAGFTPCSSPKGYAGFADGAHTFSVRATDDADNTGPAMSYTWTVDTAAPTTAITIKPSNPSNGKSPSFEFTAGESSSFECKLDTGAFASCSSPHGYVDLADGSHTFSVKATDAADNTGAATSYTWTIDTAAPAAAITVKPSNPSNVKSPSFEFTAGEAATFECKLDAGAFGPCTSPHGYVNLGDGVHTFHVKATDTASNAGPEATYTWTIDTVGPVAEITGKPAEPSNDTSPSFVFGAAGATAFECRLDGAAFAPCASPQGYAGLADGAHTFSVKATDAADNTGPAASYTWTIDTVGPTTLITGKPSDPTNSTSPSFAFEASESGTAFACKLDAASFAACTSLQGYTGLVQGVHIFHVKATDPAGNAGPEASYSWVVDTTAPTVTITDKPSDPSNNASPSFSFGANEAGSSLACKLDAGAFAPCTSPKSYAGLGDGDHTFHVKATDTASNTGPEATYTWTIDTVAPTTTITLKPADPSNVKSPSFEFTVGQAATFQCKLDAGAFGPCTSPRSYTDLGDGSHTFTAKATDTAGTTGPEATYTWTIDTVAPSTQITGKPADPSKVKSPSFVFSAGEAAAFQCKLDAGAFGPCTSPHAYTDVPDGAHTFSVKATDTAGNTGAVAVHAWTVDTAAPTATITAKPADPSNVKSPSFTFGAGEPSTFECKLDAGPFALCASPKDYVNLADGAHTFTVKATDAASNTAPEVSYSWTIDSVAPTVAITSKPNNPSNVKSPSFGFTASESAQFECKFDAGAFGPCVSPKLYADLADGDHTFTLRATDAAHNTGPEASHTWKIDTTGPTTTLTNKPADPSNTSFPTFVFTANENGSTFQCKLDGAAFTPCSSPKGYANLAEVSHTFVVKATDPLGNPGPETTYTWTVDTTPPTASITVHPDNPSNSKSPSLVFTADEPSTFECRLDVPAFAPCTSPTAYTDLLDGSHIFVVRAKDLAGNTGASVTYSWTIDTTAPIVAITQKPSDPTNDSSATFSFTAGDATNFQCKLDGEAFAPCSSPKVYSNLLDGGHAFAVKATDSLGNPGLATTVNWTIDTVAPTSAITGKPTNPSNNSAPTFTFSANEAGSTLACRLEEGGFAPCTSPKTYPNLTDGAHKFTVRATDAAGNTGPEAAHQWTIDTIAPSTTINQKPNALSTLSSAHFAFSAEPGSTFVCKLDAGVFGACASPKNYPGLAEGPHTFTVKATDPAGNTGVETSFAWSIDTIAPTTAISGKPDALTNDSTPSFTFTGSEAGSTFGCKLDGVTGSCTSPKGYPPLADGSHTFTVKATDQAGNTGAETSFTWTIDTDAPTVAITTKPSDPSNVKSPNFFFSADETAGFSCKLDVASFTACSSPKSYTNLAEGSHTFSVRATDPAGNTSLVVAHTWTVDSVAPLAAIMGKPANPSNVKSPSLVFGAGETSTFECKLDTGTFAPCASPKDYVNLVDGNHTFSVRATDSANNLGPTTSYTWKVDTVAPTATITDKPADPSKNQSPSFSFTSTEPGTFECKLDAGPFGVCASPKSYVALGDGPHTFAVKAVDQAGNTSAEKNYTWMLDATAPTTTIATKPTDPSNEKSPSFTLTADQPATFECRLDAAVFAPCASTTTYADLADGSHTFTARAIDTAANTGAERSYTWTIDTIAPTAAISGKPSNPSNNRAPSFSFTANESGSTFLCKLDAGAFAPCSSPQSYSGLLDGTHTFALSATDPAGNIGAQTAYAWQIKTRAPAAGLTSAPPGLTNSSAASFGFSADEPSSFDCKLDDRGSEPCGSPTTYHGLGDGAHTFRVRANDSVGNLGAWVPYSWTVDTTAPETTIASAPKSGTSPSATFKFASSESGTFECRLDGAPFALCASPKSYGGLSKAGHRFEVRAIDAAGNADATPAGRAWTIQAAPRTATSTSALFSPIAGARVKSPPLLAWRRVARARYYNVQLYRGTRKIFTAWPTRSRFQLRARWKFQGRKVQLKPGTYRWYVWPGYGAPSARRYGQLLGESTFVVVRRS